MENKKAKAEYYSQANKEKLQKWLREYYRYFGRWENLKNMLTLEIKICQVKIEKEKK